ncbi:unnamed protein product [Calicophoron daubneyi]|uniref:Transmembrane protein 70 n=1 Tax=Calicophoron daubneyi TaxID=300641 RepID=A0AAV2TYK0_CALDB
MPRCIALVAALNVTAFRMLHLGRICGVACRSSLLHLQKSGAIITALSAGLKRSTASIKNSDGSIVYLSPNRKLLLYAKTFSLFSSAVVLAVQPFLISKCSQSGAFIAAAVFGCGFGVVTPLLLHILTRSHVSEMYFDDSTGTYTAYTRGIFLNRKRIQFSAEEVVRMPPGLLMANLSVRGIPLFLSEADFIDVDAFKTLMAFDKPMQIKTK